MLLSYMYSWHFPGELWQKQKQKLLQETASSVLPWVLLEGVNFSGAYGLLNDKNKTKNIMYSKP